MIYRVEDGHRGTFRDANGTVLPPPLLVDTETGVATIGVVNKFGTFFHNEGEIVTAVVVFAAPISFIPGEFV